MNEKEWLLMLFDFLKGGGLLSVFASAILLKRYIINGSVNRFFALKEAEIKSLSDLREGLSGVLIHQEKLYELIRERSCIASDLKK